MARRFTLELIMDLATKIGANPAKAVSRSNISFLGKGPTKNPLFQNRLAGLENATEANLGKPETLFAAIDDAVGWAKDGKLNSIQTEILGHNLSGINKILNPPVLPSASVTAIAPGIEGLKRFPKESHRFFGRPLKDKDFSEIDQLVREGKIPGLPKGSSPGEALYARRTGGIKSRNPIVDDRGRSWDFKSKYPEGVQPGSTMAKAIDEANAIKGSRLPEPGPGEMADFTKALDQKTGMSRAIARQILQQDTRLKLKPEELLMLRTGKGEPLDLMKKYYGRSMYNMDEWLDRAVYANFTNAEEAAAAALKEIELIPQFAEGGLAEILQTPRSGYSKGRVVKGALAILNRNKKNADYMFKASDNVSPGYARGDIKYNAELLADQLAEDAGVVYADLGHLEQTKFYGTAYDYLAAEMGKHLLQKRMMKDIGQKMVLSDFSIKGRKPNASGGLARILEV